MTKFEIQKVKSIQAECLQWDSLVSVTEWQNKEGFDLGITSKNGGIQTISITYGEFNLLENIINTLINQDNG